MLSVVKNNTISSAVLFAGLGGACEGIRAATGASPLAAVNHNEHALWLHALNHPETIHYREDVFSVPPLRACRGRELDLLWMSPDCTHHSRARGGKPRETGCRSLADVVFPWVDEVHPWVIMLENVPEWLDWGPLDEDGNPIKSRKGELFRTWKTQLESAGYSVDWRILKACDYGAPTSRRRVYLCARRDGRGFRWPAPTHGPGLIPYRTAAECIDWTVQGSSIFDRKKPIVAATMARIEDGVRRFGGVGRSWLIQYYGTGLSASIDEPLPTVTTKDRFAIVTQGLSDITLRMLQPRELARAMGFPESYRIDGSHADQVARIGNAVAPPVAEAIVRNML